MGRVEKLRKGKGRMGIRETGLTGEKRTQWRPYGGENGKKKVERRGKVGEAGKGKNWNGKHEEKNEEKV